MSYSIRFDTISRGLVNSAKRTPRFDCGESELNEYFFRYAAPSQNKRLSRTQVLLIEDKVVGFYTLTATTLEPKSVQFTLNSSNLGPFSVPAVLLARMALRKEYQGQGYGTHLLGSIAIQAMTAMETIGGVGIIVDPKRPELIRYYENLGFLACGKQWLLPTDDVMSVADSYAKYELG